VCLDWIYRNPALFVVITVKQTNKGTEARLYEKQKQPKGLSQYEQKGNYEVKK
jgi:hypothetical protein